MLFFETLQLCTGWLFFDQIYFSVGLAAGSMKVLQTDGSADGLTRWYPNVEPMGALPTVQLRRFADSTRFIRWGSGRNLGLQEKWFWAFA
jgi:hypothetical protein